MIHKYRAITKCNYFFDLSTYFSITIYYFCFKGNTFYEDLIKLKKLKILQQITLKRNKKNNYVTILNFTTKHYVKKLTS